jgi:diguanylate cyclase (GGDEF)-like protein/PAS domain S-box-containing protein
VYTNLSQALLVFFSLFSFASAALLSLYHMKEQRNYVMYWIAASVLIGVGGLTTAFMPYLDQALAYQASVICVFVASLLFNHSLSILLGWERPFKRLIIYYVITTAILLACLWFVREYIGPNYQPAVVAVSLAIVNFYGFLLALKFYRENQLGLAAALSITFLITALLWFIRFIVILQLKVGFAFEGGIINAVIFVTLLILSILRFMIFGGLAIELLEIKRIRIADELSQLKLDLADQRVAKSEQQLRHVLEITGDGIWDWNIATGEVKHNDRWYDIVGHTALERQMSHNEFKMYVHPDDLGMVLNHLELTVLNNVPYQLQYRMVRGDGHIIWVQDQGQVVERKVNGEPSRMIGAITDISIRKKNQDQINELAFFDQLTNLPNRNYIKDRIYRAINESIRNKTYSGLIYLDLDDFKNVNDRYGHHAGDILLTEFGKRIQQTIRPKDIIARIGGDEFLILLEQVSSTKLDATNMLEQIIERIDNSLLEPMHLGNGINVNIKISSGVVIFGEEVAKFDDILKFADLAMYSAKRDNGVSHRFFDEHMQADFDRTISLVDELSEACDAEQLFAVYQPIIDREGRCLAYEALARWNHPKRGIVMPDDFIPFAMEGGKIIQVGNAIFKYILSHREVWKRSSDHSIMINVSTDELLNPGFADHLIAMCAIHDVPMDRLNLELTENAFLSNINLAREVMIHLHKHGIQFALDDFGTGYASLRYLADLPFQYLKIDRIFISGLGQLKVNEVIVDAILDLAKGLKMKAIAEGVETREQYEILCQKGCEYFQGWYFGKPSESIPI